MKSFPKSLSDTAVFQTQIFVGLYYPYVRSGCGALAGVGGVRLIHAPTQQPTQQCGPTRCGMAGSRGRRPENLGFSTSISCSRSTFDRWSQSLISGTPFCCAVLCKCELRLEPDNQPMISPRLVDICSGQRLLHIVESTNLQYDDPSLLLFGVTRKL